MTSRFITPIYQATDSNGKSVSGAQLFFYEAGSSSTLKATYTDSSQTTENSNPVVADGSGVFPNIYGSGTYKVILKYATTGRKANVQIWERDNVIWTDGQNTAKDGGTLQEAIADESLILGDLVLTTGYTTENDGGGYSYLVESLGSDDGFQSILMDSGLYLTLIEGGQVDFRVTGAQPSVDCSSELITAANSGLSILVTGGSYIATVATSSINDFFDNTSAFTFKSPMEITIEEGEVSRTEQIVIESEGANNLSILGADTVQPSIVSFVSSSGSAQQWFVDIELSSVSNISVGDYALINVDITGTDDYYSVMGVWEITAVSDPNITVKITGQYSTFPTLTLTGGAIDILKTKIVFTGSDGFRFENGDPIGELNNLALVGDYDLAAATGTTGAHGLVIALPVVTPGSDSNEVFNPDGSFAVGDTFGISAFGEQGIVVAGRSSVVCNYIASCSNRKRGMYSEGGHIRSKLSICSGNGEDGYIADLGGVIQASLSVASGNVFNGFFQINNSELACATSKATSNGTRGYESRGLGRMGADIALALNNTLDGFSVSDGGMLDADSADSDGNGDAGFVCVNNGTIDCNNSTSQNNGTIGFEARNEALINAAGATITGNGGDDYFSVNSLIVQSDSTIFPSVTQLGGTSFYPEDRSHDTEVSVSSIGDFSFSLDAVSRIIIKNATGEFRATVDNTQTLGSASNRWAEVFAGIGTINTSDEREKTNVLPITDEVLDAWETVEFVQYQWTASLEKKGAEARYHIGLLAQDILRKFEAKGLDATRYGFLCYDKWEDEYDGDKLMTESGDRWGIRPDQCLFMESALMRRELNKLKS